MDPILERLQFHIEGTGAKMQDEEPDDTPETYLKWLETAVYVDEPVGLFSIVIWALGFFPMQSAQAIDYVDRCITVLLSSGAIPCRPCGQPGPEWIETTKYGSDPDHIRAAVLAEWIADGGGMIAHWSGPFFGAPRDVALPNGIERQG
ncbi:hypothetical protein [Methyloraptor flagellatus]|uniref:Uncharacterized protein n=1 Tax=Methyloraptor flagellatus TaxID=3162530 RepID=A0AAU7XBW6_9HYPH